MNIVVDIDECEEKVSECEQACVNKPGSYVCGCRSGFSFVRGLHGTCVGKMVLTYISKIHKKRILQFLQ